MSEECRHTRVVHRTVYRYARPVTLLPHRLVVRPREGHDMQIERFALAVSPRAVVSWSRDIFGNSIARVHFEEQSDELRIEVSFVARRSGEAVDANPPALPAVPYPMDYDALEEPVTAVYRTPLYPADTTAVQEWLHTSPVDSDAPAAEILVRQLTRRVHDTIAYRRREEKGVQSPAATLALASGSCRDQATLFMECLRHLGIASRFVTGYLDCPATRAGRGSTHAWCEAYFPDLGWRGFDPSTGHPCTPCHIAVASSHHPRGVMPVSGRYQGISNALVDMSVSVQVEELPASSLLTGESLVHQGPPEN
jgi:transglutaminase-like putative cysteine protease